MDPSCLTNTSVIVTSPRNVTVCAGASAEFRCVTSAALLQWSVDGVEAYRSAVQTRNISFVTTSYSKDGSYGYTSTLTVYGSIANGNSSIKCSALYDNVLYESDVAILVVQGSLMASVNAAAIGLNSTHVLLTWGPPGDAINPALLNYIVVIRNGSATRGQLVTAVNETSAIVSLSLLSKCDTSFIIQPMCSTTAGNTTSVQWYSDGNSTIKVTTELTADAAKITILGIAMCTIGYYRVAIANSRQNWNMNVKSFSDGISFDYLLSIGHNEKVFANVILYNDKLYKNGRVIAITTFDVTSARLLEPTPRIQCSFNLGSTAKGCLALFDDGNRSYYLFVRRNSTSADEATSDALQGVPSGNYTLLIYDVEVTGTPSSSPALSDNVSITGQAFTAADEADKKKRCNGFNQE